MSNNSNRDVKLDNFSVAPYNFVSLPVMPVARYNSIEELPAHNDYKGRDNKELFSGCIEYVLKAEMPVIVSTGSEKEDRKAEFFENERGEKAIPGNTIRGMLRTNAQILSFSSVLKDKDENGNFKSSDIQDARFLFRDIASNNSLSEKYKDVLGIKLVNGVGIAKNIQAGYITKEGKEYYLQVAKRIKEDKPYIRVDEIHLRKIVDKDVLGIYFMYETVLVDYEDEIRKLNKQIAEAKKKNYRDYKSEGRLKEIFNECKKEYIPYSSEISFDMDNKNLTVSKIGIKGKYNYQGVILSGGFIPGKRSHYIIMEEDGNTAKIGILPKQIEDYKKDLIMTKKAKKSEDGIPKVVEKYKFFDLPGNKEKKPVFYINHADSLHFGFTPYLRLFYSKGVLDGVSETYKGVNGISYSDAIFGFTDSSDNKGEKVSYKSRVSFEDAVVIGNPTISKENIMELILAEPKPTSYNLYLKQDENGNKKELNIYEDKFEIRGIKQYWMKDYIKKWGKDKNEKMPVKIYPLEKGTKFKGKVYFSNLYEDELGLLLWSLKLNDNCFQTIGLAKPYGFGRVKVEDIELQVEIIGKKYSDFCFDYMEADDINKYISVYKEKFSKENLSGENIEDQKPVKELIAIKSKVVKENELGYYRYMDIDLKEFRERKYLPEILNNEKSINKPAVGRSNYSGNNNNKKMNRNFENTKKTDNKHNNFTSNLSGNEELAKKLTNFKRTLEKDG